MVEFMTRHSREALYGLDKAVLVEMLVQHEEQIDRLGQAVQALQNASAKHSGNSSQPPSSDGLKKPAPKSVYDSTDSKFYLRNTNTTGNADVTFQFGNPGDIPLAGRWDSTMHNDAAGTYRNSNGMVFLLKKDPSTGVADYQILLGIPGDLGITGDWDGDGLDSVGAYRPSNSVFYLNDQVGSGAVYGSYEVTLGTPDAANVPLAGDWIAQGKHGIGLFNRTSAQFLLKNALTNGFADTTFTFGSNGAYPIAGHWMIAPAPGQNAPATFVPSTGAPAGAQ